MSYLPYRDRPALAGVTERQQGLIFELGERLETEAQQAFHNSECSCPEGTPDFRRCHYGARWISVDVDEILAALLVEGYLTEDAIQPPGRASD